MRDCPRTIRTTVEGFKPRFSSSSLEAPTISPTHISSPLNQVHTKRPHKLPTSTSSHTVEALSPHTICIQQHHSPISPHACADSRAFLPKQHLAMFPIRCAPRARLRFRIPSLSMMINSKPRRLPINLTPPPQPCGRIGYKLPV